MNTTNFSNVQVFLTGDNHGYYDALFDKLDKYDIKNCLLIHVGDGGEGFCSTYVKNIRQFELLNNTFKKRDITYISIRGNHSNPAFFDGSIDYSHFKLFKDYTTLEINGEKWLFVGGAISIDRTLRRPGYSYWKDETFVLDESKIVECDVLVTHSGPNWIGPYDKNGIASYCNRDEGLWDECVKERNDHNRLYELAKPKYAYFLGHFHCYENMKKDNCNVIILDELQIYEYKKSN